MAERPRGGAERAAGVPRPRVERPRPGVAKAAQLEGGLRAPGPTLGSLAAEGGKQPTRGRRGPAPTPPPPPSTPTASAAPETFQSWAHTEPNTPRPPESTGIDDFRRQTSEMDRGAPGATVGRPTSPDRAFVGAARTEPYIDTSAAKKPPEKQQAPAAGEPEAAAAPGAKKPETAPSGTAQKPKTPEFTPQEQERIQKEVERRLKEEKYRNATPEQLEKMSLEAKIDAGIATKEDLIRFRKLSSSETPEQELAALQEKIKTGNFTDKDAERFVQLTQKEANVEQTLEQLNKQAEEVMMRILRGQGNLEDNILELHRLKELVDKRSPVMSEDRARELVRRVLNPEDSGLLGKRELALQKEVRAKIERLMALDLYLIAEYPQQSDQLREAANDTKNAIKAKKREASSGSDEDKLKKRMELYQLYMHLANLRADSTKLENAANIMEAEHKDITQYLDRRLGVTSPIMSFVSFADAKISQARAHTREEMGFFTDI